MRRVDLTRLLSPLGYSPFGREKRSVISKGYGVGD
jgi:hypothetical protein